MTSTLQSATLCLFAAFALIDPLNVVWAQGVPDLDTSIPTVPPVSESTVELSIIPIVDLPDPAESVAAKDWPALQVWFHQPQFNILDGLNSY
jgi:hypothetical protein